MNHSSRRIVSLVLCLCLLLSFVPAMVVEAEAASTRTIYFDKSGTNWRIPACYTWNSSGACSGSWPGTIMTYVAENIYSCQVPSDATHIIFNNNNEGAQSDDLVLPTDGRDLYTAGGTWSTYVPVESDECSHDYVITSTPPTCLNEGADVYNCSKCGDRFTLIQGATGHSYHSKVTTAPTCTKTGIRTYTCTACGDAYTEIVLATGHNYSGSKCTNCGKVKPSCSHRYTAEVTIVPTCLEDGAKTYTCSQCGDVYTEVVAATGHSFVDIIVPPTCDMNGYTQHRCENCGMYSFNSDAVNPIGHNYSAVATPPTCTQKGYTTYTCANCGDVYTWNEIPATGHRYINGQCTSCGGLDPDHKVEYYLFGYINGKDYACEGDAANMGIYKFEAGKLTATFTQDSYVAVKTGGNATWYMTNSYMGSSRIARLYDASTLSTPNKLFVPGNVEVIFTLAFNPDGSLTLSYANAVCTHSYTSKVTTAATCTKSGVKTFTCTKCADQYTQSIPATGHSYSGGKCISCGAKDPSTGANSYYLFGYINGTNYACEENHENLGSFKFEGGKLTVTFTSDSYVGVKTSDNANWYMTKGWQGTEKTSVTLYNTQALTNADKFYVPGNVEVTFTLKENTNGTVTLSYTLGTCSHQYAGGVCTSCGAADPNNKISTYYLFGYINGQDHACQWDAGNVGEYRFVNGKLTTTFTTGSYVAVKCSDNATWYMTDGWQGTDKKSVTLYESRSLTNADKLYVPGGVQVTFTLSENSDGTLNLSYTTSGSVSSSKSTKPSFELKYPTVSFEDMIVLNVYYAASNLKDVEEMGLVTFNAKVSSCNINNADHVVPGYAWSISDGYYVSSSAGIAAKNLGDTIYFAVYARLKDGTYTYSNLVSYSPKTYAYNQLKSGNEEMQALVVAMLNYGAMAQTYFHYNTDALINAELTAAQKALVKSYSASMLDDVVLPNTAKLGSMTDNGGYASRYPTISFEGVFCINYYFKPSKTPTGNITMYVWNQADYDAATSLSKGNATQVINMTKTSSDEYVAVVDGIAAKNLDQGVYVSFCYTSGSKTYCSGVVGYSIGSYCASQASKTGTLADLSAACAVYGYYAKQLFA